MILVGVQAWDAPPLRPALQNVSTINLVQRQPYRVCALLWWRFDRLLAALFTGRHGYQQWRAVALLYCGGPGVMLQPQIDFKSLILSLMCHPVPEYSVSCAIPVPGKH